MVLSCKDSIDIGLVCQYYDRSNLRITALNTPELEGAGSHYHSHLPCAGLKRFATCPSCSAVPCLILSIRTVVPQPAARHSSVQTIRRKGAVFRDSYLWLKCVNLFCGVRRCPCFCL